MRLRRTVPNAPAQFVNLTGFATLYQPGEIEGPIQQGDERVLITNDEIKTAGWTEVRRSDWLLKDGKQQTIQGSVPVMEGDVCIGHTLWVRG